MTAARTSTKTSGAVPPGWRKEVECVLITEQQLARRVRAMSREIQRDFKGREMVIVSLLSGTVMFLADLIRHISLPLRLDFIGVSSYGNRPSPTQELQSGWDSTGEVRLTKDVDHSMRDKNLILVEDILDTGLTLTYLRRILMAHQPRSFKIAALLDKPSRRKQAIEADYVGFKIPDEFVVGYGLDYAERYRNLPDICIIPRN